MHNYKVVVSFISGSLTSWQCKLEAFLEKHEVDFYYRNDKAFFNLPGSVLLSFIEFANKNNGKGCEFKLKIKQP